MHVARPGNLTVALIRFERFSPEGSASLGRCHPLPDTDRQLPSRWPSVDRVLLSSPGPSPGAGAGYDACRPMAELQRCDQAEPVFVEQSLAPRTITPVQGSPALAGLGVALVVPGTLLDVVA